MRRVALLRSVMRAKAITYNWHDADTSLIEAVLSRGDRRIGTLLEEVWRTGGRLDAWSEHFSMERWMRAFEKCGLDPDFYASRERSPDEMLPWSHINVGVSPEYLKKERDKAHSGETTPDCRACCTGCGAVSLAPEVGCDA